MAKIAIICITCLFCFTEHYILLQYVFVFTKDIMLNKKRVEDRRKEISRQHYCTLEQQQKTNLKDNSHSLHDLQ